MLPPVDLSQLLSEFGVLAFFLVFILEGAMLLYIAPSESLMPVAVTLLADGTADILLFLAVATVGATIGQYLLFWVSRNLGRDRLLESRFVRIPEKHIDRFDRWFERWGRPIVPVSNALPFTRGMLTVPAGLSEMRGAEFIVLSAIGTLVFESALALITLGVLQGL